MATTQIAQHLATQSPQEFRCPECGCAQAYRSQRRNWKERLRCWYQGVLPYRCRKCDLRFFTRKPSR